MTVIICDVCGREFERMDDVLDHLEQSHSVVSRAVRRNTTEATTASEPSR